MSDVPAPGSAVREPGNNKHLRREDLASHSSAQETRASQRQLLMSIVPAMLGRLAWSRAEIDSFQLERLRTLLRHAKQESAWHARRLSDIDPEHFELADLAQLPIMSKAEFMENWDSIVTIPDVTLDEVSSFVAGLTEGQYFRDEYHAVSSGGTSGQTLMTIFGWEAFAEHMAGIFRGYAALFARTFAGRIPRVASIGADSAQHISYALNQTFSDPANPIVKISASLSDDLLAARLGSLQPHMLIAYPSALARILSLSMTGGLQIEPELIVSVSEVLSSELLQRLRQYWDCPVVDVWSSTESSGTFACLGPNRFHVSEDLNVIEEAPDGDGVLVTNLYNLAVPLIRYRLDDRFEFADRPCPCGSQFQPVARVHGRVWDIVRLDGRDVHEIVFLEALDKFASVVDYQLVQVGPGVEVRVLANGPLDCALIASALKEKLTQLGASDSDLRVVRVPELVKSRVGKTIRSLRPT